MRDEMQNETPHETQPPPVIFCPPAEHCGPVLLELPGEDAALRVDRVGGVFAVPAAHASAFDALGFARRTDA